MRELFTWTAGALNSTAYTSSLWMRPGSTGTISPGVGNTITTGSSIELLGNESVGAQLEFLPGTMELENAAAINVRQFCAVKIDVSNGVIEFEGKNVDANPINLHADGTAEVFARQGFPETWRSKNVPISIYGGTLTVRPGAIADVTGKLNGTGPSVQMVAGKITLYDDASLGVEHSLVASGGVLATKFRGLPGTENTWPSVVRGVSRIFGDVLINGAQVYPYSDQPSRRPVSGQNLPAGNPYIFSTLEVTGNVYWVMGTYRPAVAYGANDQTYADLWLCKGTFTISHSTTINPTLIGTTGGPLPTYPANPPVPDRWVVLASSLNIVYTDITYLQYWPSITTDAPWCMVEPPDHPKVLFIKPIP